MRKTLHTIAFTFSAIFFLTTLSFLENVHVGFKGSDKFLAEIKNIFPELSLDNAEMRFLPEPHLYFNKLAYEKKLSNVLIFEDDVAFYKNMCEKKYIFAVSGSE